MYARKTQTTKYLTFLSQYDPNVNRQIFKITPLYNVYTYY